MFDIGFSEMILLAAIALVAIGPKQLPEVARTIGRTLNELKRATGDIGKTVMDARQAANDGFLSVANKITEDMTRSPEASHQANKTVAEQQDASTAAASAASSGAESNKAES